MFQKSLLSPAHPGQQRVPGTPSGSRQNNKYPGASTPSEENSLNFPIYDFISHLITAEII